MSKLKALLGGLQIITITGNATKCQCLVYEGLANREFRDISKLQGYSIFSVGKLLENTLIIQTRSLAFSPQADSRKKIKFANYCSNVHLT